jgi:DNA-binding transcriptional regulator GbsR (MarR family)
VAAEAERAKKLSPLLEAKLQVAEQLGALMEFWGFKRVLGRIWTVLYLSDHPLTAAELSLELDLSPSAISLAMTELKRWGVVHEDLSLPSRTRRAQTYRAERDVWSMVNNVFRQREIPLIIRTQEVLKGAIARLEAQPATPEHRHALKALKGLSTLTSAARAMLETLLATGKASAEALRRFGAGP